MSSLNNLNTPALRDGIADPPEAPPEPLAPQGEYNPQIPEAPLSLPDSAPTASHGPAELLSPAGGPEAAYAAFHYGANAIYLGLRKFSARAEAENFTLDEVDEITSYAHSRTPRRRVFVTVNTVVLQNELSELVYALGALSDIGVDALLVQDLGVYRIVRRYFPNLTMHASTQLAVHNCAGAKALKELGFSRVVLARELTLDEVREITATCGIETEVFIHGALCYAYSGLCLFSSQTLGRSGNRGRCAYSCRDQFQVSGAPATLRDGTPTKRDPNLGFAFSMKDLALPDHLPAFQDAGLSCFKIEGRKKSPLYVATVTDFYRKLLDGTLPPDSRAAHESDIKAVFSRPWTRLFVQSHKDKEVADRDTVGHRGSPIGIVDAVVPQASRQPPLLRFTTERSLERHDGLQIDIPGLGRPFGFAVDQLQIVKKGARSENVFEAPAGALVEVAMPQDHPPIPPQATIYCSSSQDVKRRYRHSHPKPGLFHTRRAMDLLVQLTPERLTAIASLANPALSATLSIDGPFAPAKDPAKTEAAIRGAFEKLGNTHLSLGQFSLSNPQALFVPISQLNQLRRDLTAKLEQTLETSFGDRVATICREILPQPRSPQTVPARDLNWSIKVDRIAFLDDLESTDWQNIDEAVIEIARDQSTVLCNKLEALAQKIGREHIRLALPVLTRKWEEKDIAQKVSRLRAAGWTKWEASNLSSWTFLGLPMLRAENGKDVAANLATDWSLYVVNRAAALQMLDLGASRFALSPEDGLDNMRSLLAEFGAQATVIVHQDTPLFLAESCAYANLIGGCPGKANCRFEKMEMVSNYGEKVTAFDYRCRTITLNKTAFCLTPYLKELAAAGATSVRADFVYRDYSSQQVRDIWRLLHTGKNVPGGHAANFARGML
ncbi:MAG TPA: U32 family peptidase [Planctomycetota bacterium]|jgi:putative protease